MPLLTANDIRLVGIGMEELGVEEFVKGDYFLGDLYIDPKKAAYEALGYRRFNICTIIMSLFTRTAWSAAMKARRDRVRGDLRGDGFQNGGLLIVKKGGQEVLLSYRQENPADHVENAAVLNALGIVANTDLQSDA